MEPEGTAGTDDSLSGDETARQEEITWQRFPLRSCDAFIGNFYPTVSSTPRPPKEVASDPRLAELNGSRCGCVCLLINHMTQAVTVFPVLQQLQRRVNRRLGLPANSLWQERKRMFCL